MTPRRIMAAACVSMLTTTLSAQRIVRVPQDYATIQAGINAAVNRDIVEIADGVYSGPGNYGLVFNGRKIIVRSANGRDNCIIDCQNNGRGFDFNSPDGEAVVEGLTITRASEQAFFASSPGSPTIRNCRVTACVFDSGDGGGVVLQTGTPIVEGCLFDNNHARRYGGAVSVGSSASPTLRDCVFINNTARDAGGGIYAYLGQTQAGLVIQNCVIAGNSAADSGGGLHSDKRAPLIVSNSIIRDNMAALGGGIYCKDASAMIWNTVIEQNTAGYDGGGVYFYGSNPVALQVRDCTFIANVAIRRGGAVFVTGFFGEPSIVNSLSWLNGAALGWELAVDPYAHLSVAHSNVQGGPSAVHVEAPGVLDWGAGNIDADPGLVALFDGDYHLGSGSPCIDAANNTAVPQGVVTDLDGNPRFVDDPHTIDTGVPGNGHPEVVDMGAYEFQPPPCNPCDANCDGETTAFDIEPFLDLLFNGDPPCNTCTGDVNGDGTVDAFDIEPFVTCLFGP